MKKKNSLFNKFHNLKILWGCFSPEWHKQSLRRQGA